MRGRARSASAPVARASAASVPVPKQLLTQAFQLLVTAGPRGSFARILLLAGSCTCAFSLLFDNNHTNHIRDERPLSSVSMRHCPWQKSAPSERPGGACTRSTCTWPLRGLSC